MNINDMPKYIYFIVNHHNLNKPIITKCITKYENAYMFYNDVITYLSVLPFQNIFSFLGKGKLQIYISQVV
jgi:hypothetical protein